MTTDLRDQLSQSYSSPMQCPLNCKKQGKFEVEAILEVSKDEEIPSPLLHILSSHSAALKVNFFPLYPTGIPRISQQGCSPATGPLHQK